MRWLWKKNVDDEVAEELELHLEMRTREYVARGLDPDTARETAIRRFGDLDNVRKTCREIGRKRDKDMRRRETFTELRQDVTFAVRQLVTHPVFSLIAVLTLALGIGATTAIFSVVNAVVLRPLPVPRPEQLTLISGELNGELTNLSVGNYMVLAENQRSFSGVSAIRNDSFNLSQGESAERTLGARVTASLFDVFGIQPALGRVFRAEEDQPGREDVVVLSHRLWQRRFGADRGIVGREIRMNGQPYTVLGVMPPFFSFRSDREELWVPIAFTPKQKAMYDEQYLTVVGRYRDGVTPEQAQQDLERIATVLRPVDRVNVNFHFHLDSFMKEFVGDYRTRLLVLLGAVGLVLLIACGNVANLLLARSAVRGREVAIRAALGAGRGRIVRQLLTESAVLALVSAAIGLVIAWWGIRALLFLVPPGVPRIEQASIDGVVLAFTLGLAILSSVVFGLAPALRAARSSLSAALKEGGRGSAGTRGRDWLRSALISAEVALAVLLLVGAGLLIRSALEMQRIRPGFEPRGVMTARLSLPAAEYADAARVVDTFDRLTEKVSVIPGVRFAAVATKIPVSPGGGGNGLLPEGKAVDMANVIAAQLSIVTPGYFQAMGIPLLRGRGFDATDRRGAQKVMIVNQALAESMFPGQDPLGKKVGCCETGPDGETPDYKVIVGVAANLHSNGLAEAVDNEFWLPVAQAPPEAWEWFQRTMYIVARTSGEPESLTPALRRTVTEIDPDIPLYSESTMEKRMVQSTATARFNTLLLTLLGVIGLILSAVGIYGVIAYFVTQRTSEIGVRMALGATQRHVVRLVLRQAAIPVIAGIVLGLAASVAATRVLAAYLVGVEPTDPLTLASVVAVLAVAALLASFVPALRAASVPPTQALQAG
ncbi:MAG TPA: ABC transporter permease [Thermoanaerobaculia bacterium]|nr:ABC transporter permease [Thermoanaerobaculia bacterium]